MLYDYDFTNKIIDIPFGIDTVQVIDLINDIREVESTSQGILYGQIATASGNESLGGSVYTGITVNLLDNWQIRFTSGNYIAKITGGNLVGGIGGDPVAYSAGVQVLLVQSAASTIVVTSDGLNAAQAALLETAANQSTIAATQSTKSRQMQTNKAVISGDGRTVSIYTDDGTSLLHVFNISQDKLTREPQ